MVSIVKARSTVAGYADVNNEEVRCVAHATPLWQESEDVVTLHLDNNDLKEMWCDVCIHRCFTDGIRVAPSLYDLSFA
jgi:hypothetical protein